MDTKKFNELGSFSSSSSWKDDLISIHFMANCRITWQSLGLNGICKSTNIANIQVQILSSRNCPSSKLFMWSIINCSIVIFPDWEYFVIFEKSGGLLLISDMNVSSLNLQHVGSRYMWDSMKLRKYLKSLMALDCHSLVGKHVLGEILMVSV